MYTDDLSQLLSNEYVAFVPPVCNTLFKVDVLRIEVGAQVLYVFCPLVGLSFLFVISSFFAPPVYVADGSVAHPWLE